MSGKNHCKTCGNFKICHDFEDGATLGGLMTGESARIFSIGKNGGAMRQRLVDIGLTPGTLVTVTRRAPFGDPTEIRVRGYNLSLRRDDLEKIRVCDVLSRFCERENKPRTRPKRKMRLSQKSMRLDHDHENLFHKRICDRTAHDRRGIRIALSGNPNCGKSTIFNALTGSNQYVGNWPGVTVEKKEGRAQTGGKDVTIVDLPGIYSLSPYSIEEIVARDFLIGASESPPDVIIDIVDATNLERNLYLAAQLLELERPMIIAVNFMDEARERGYEIDAEKLAREIGVPVVPVTGKTGENLSVLLDVAHKQIHAGFSLEPDDLYDDFTHETHHRIGKIIHDKAYRAGLPGHFASIKIMEGDSLVTAALMLTDAEFEAVREILAEYEAECGGFGDSMTLIADSRYRYIEKVLAACVKKGARKKAEIITEKIDKILTHKIFALPIFLLTMFLMFAAVFGPIGSFLSEIFGKFVTGGAFNFVDFLLKKFAAPAWAHMLAKSVIVQGVGGVVGFVPQIFLLFLGMSILEDSGYMSRVAFIMDRPFRRFGLSGKAFIPMLMGFGCSVPAIMGARALESETDRRMAIMLVPFMSCSAKLPIYSLFAVAFFGRRAGLIIFALYIFGIIAGLLSALVFKKFFFKNKSAFLLELPPYRFPSIKSALRHCADQVKDFVFRAGTLIFLMSVFLWFLQNFDLNLRLTQTPENGMLARFGGFIAPIFAPLGFGFWQAAVALISGLIAKEAIVSSLSMMCGFSQIGAAASIIPGFSPLSALSFLIFVLLYVPCVAAVSTTFKEMKSLKWAAFSVFWQIFVAYLASILFYHGAQFLGV